MPRALLARGSFAAEPAWLRASRTAVARSLYAALVRRIFAAVRSLIEDSRARGPAPKCAASILASVDCNHLNVLVILSGTFAGRAFAAVVSLPLLAGC